VKLNKRLQILLMFIAAAALIVWISDQPQPADSVRVVETAVGSDNALHGQLSVVFGDAFGLTRSETHGFVTEHDGDVFEIAAADSLLLAFNGLHVDVIGTWFDSDLTRTDDAPLLAVERLQEANDYHATVEGNERWVNVACRFGDMPDETPQPLEYFEDIMKNSEPGMDHYWRQTSTDLVNIEGSGAYGWYNLPQPKSYYERQAAVNVGIALQVMLRDCVTLAAENDGVNFKQYSGINIMLNDTFGCCAWGGSMPLTIDGETITFRTTWLPPWAFNELHVIAHEMGHGWGLPHSGGSRQHARYPYDSAWDIMSGGSMMVPQCSVGNSVFKCFQVGTIGYHLEKLGWIPDARIVTVNPGQSATVTLDALTTVRSGNNDLLVNIPISSTGSAFFTVEARSFTHYDRNLPGEAIILHEVIPSRNEPANVVDIDDNIDVNDEGAMWLPGETFSDSRGISVEVLSRAGTTFTVRITNDS